jgi:hypothetical protein
MHSAYAASSPPRAPSRRGALMGIPSVPHTSLTRVPDGGSGGLRRRHCATRGAVAMKWMRVATLPAGTAIEIAAPSPQAGDQHGFGRVAALLTLSLGVGTLSPKPPRGGSVVVTHAVDRRRATKVVMSGFVLVTWGWARVWSWDCASSTSWDCSACPSRPELSPSSARPSCHDRTDRIERRPPDRGARHIAVPDPPHGCGVPGGPGRIGHALRGASRTPCADGQDAARADRDPGRTPGARSLGRAAGAAQRTSTSFDSHGAGTPSRVEESHMSHPAPSSSRTPTIALTPTNAPICREPSGC